MDNSKHEDNLASARAEWERADPGEFRAARDGKHKPFPQELEFIGEQLQRCGVPILKCEKCGAHYPALIFERLDGTNAHFPMNQAVFHQLQNGFHSVGDILASMQLGSLLSSLFGRDRHDDHVHEPSSSPDDWSSWMATGQHE